MFLGLVHSSSVACPSVAIVKHCVSFGGGERLAQALHSHAVGIQTWCWVLERCECAGDTEVGGSPVVSRTYAPGCSCQLGSNLFHHGYQSMEQLDPNNPQRYQISLSIPTRLNLITLKALDVRQM